MYGIPTQLIKGKKHFFFEVCMQHLCERVRRSSKQRANVFVFCEAQQSLDIDIVQLWSSEVDGSFEACCTLCVFYTFLNSASFARQS